MRRLMLLAFPISTLLSSCSGTAMDPDDRFDAGRWQLEAWFESDQGSTQGQPGSPSDTVNLTQQQAGYPPASVFFFEFYHGERDWGDVSFRGGKVGGSLHQGSVDVPMSGTYARDHFLVKLHYKGASQVVEGKLVEPASSSS
jgi:hypothetical protein